MTKTEHPIVVYAALAANVGIAIAKFVAATITGSSAMFAEAIHSVSDTGNELLLLVGMRRARHPPDKHHPFGYGKELYFWGLMVAMMVFAVGGGMSLFQGIVHLWHPRALRDAGLTYLVLGVSFALEFASFVIGLRKLAEKRGDRTLLTTWQDSKDPAVFTVVAEDGAALAGILFAFTGVFGSTHFHAPSLDAIASLAIGGLLIFVALMLVYENRGLLIGESARAPLVADLRGIIEHDPEVQAVGPLLTMHLGPRDILLGVELEFVATLRAAELGGAVRRIERAIQKAHPIVTRIYIEASALHSRA
ncbi:MAG TPA: cation diffusion facilitator family transporter [Polyangiaceae bacterium]|nr:cation diffusion facilitator family transporter [Polyangiaceae bacterium]